MAGGVLDNVVQTYVDDLTDALTQATAGLDGVDTSGFERDVTNEALNLVCAMVDADGRHTDEELDALIDAFMLRLPDLGLVRSSPAALRNSALVAGRAAWLAEDTELFKLLLAADRRHGGTLADRYYDHTMDVAHVVASLDVVTTRDELAAIARLRSRLLAGLRSRHDDGHSLTPRSGNGEAADPPDPPPAPLPPERPLEELLAELDDLIGLDGVKDRVHLVADFLRVQQLRGERDLPTVDTSHHLVFTGNPGTGKTTVARLLAQIFRSLGVVERGHLVEVDRSALVAGYVGQTAPLVTKVFDTADGGMLFIDEAYTLSRGGENDFGREAIDQIVKLMEDRRDSVVLVVAGYTEEMEQFISTNPGLRSRFPTTIEFPDYTTEELLAIVESVGEKQRYHLTDSAREALHTLLASMPRTKGFGNARTARNIYEAAVNRHATRVVSIEAPSEEQLVTLEAEDIPRSADSVDEPPRRRPPATAPGGPAPDDPAADDPAADDPAAHDPVADDPAGDEPAAQGAGGAAHDAEEPGAP